MPRYEREINGTLWSILIDEEAGIFEIDAGDVRVAEGTSRGGDDGETPTIRVGQNVGVELRRGLPRFILEEDAVEAMGEHASRLVRTHVAPAVKELTKGWARKLFPPTRRERRDRPPAVSSGEESNDE